MQSSTAFRGFLRDRRKVEIGDRYTNVMCKTMSNMPVNVAVFFGKVDRRPSGWYWTPISDGEIPHSESIVGPFESKPKAVEDANQKMQPCA